MKHIVFRILLVFSLVTLFVLGVDWMLETSGVAREFLGLTAEEWPGLRRLENIWAVWALGAAALLLPVITAATWVLAGRDDHIVATTGAGDVIRLTPGAIERVVDREVRGKVADVIRVKSIARQGQARSPRVQVNIAVSDRTDVPSVERATREEAVAALRTMLGVGEQEHVKVVVYDIKGVSTRARKRREKAVAKREEKSAEKPEKAEKPAKPPKAEKPAEPPKPRKDDDAKLGEGDSHPTRIIQKPSLDDGPPKKDKPAGDG